MSSSSFLLPAQFEVELGTAIFLGAVYSWSQWLDEKWKTRIWPNLNLSHGAKYLTTTVSNLEGGRELKSDSFF